MSVVYRFSVDVSLPRDGTDVVREDFVWRKTTDAELEECNLLRTVSRAILHGEDATNDEKDGERNGNGKGNGKAEADVLAIVRPKSAFGWKQPFRIASWERSMGLGDRWAVMAIITGLGL
ncbi:hypothetical protein ColLi_03758 [Colletotrichum liriopes]|uniref:Uncharacterized protein n=1 Tax=Colletotrichum liriopes TaxID=708192 RepID=A0AA37LPZ3_9PEZI|nr:hypothetical protein ColLi_03758 [Colletotrichum liriopes]